MELTYQQIVDADESSSSNIDKPELFGLQTLTVEECEALMSFLSGNYERAPHVSYGLTSQSIANYAKRQLKEAGYRVRVSNLMVKAALSLLGYEPSVEDVDIRHYHIRSRKRSPSPD